MDGTRGSVQPGNFSPAMAESGRLHMNTRTEQANGHCISWLYCPQLLSQPPTISGSGMVCVEYESSVFILKKSDEGQPSCRAKLPCLPKAENSTHTDSLQFFSKSRVRKITAICSHSLKNQVSLVPFTRYNFGFKTVVGRNNKSWEEFLINLK